MILLTKGRWCKFSTQNPNGFQSRSKLKVHIMTNKALAGPASLPHWFNFYLPPRGLLTVTQIPYAHSHLRAFAFTFRSAWNTHPRYVLGLPPNSFRFLLKCQLIREAFSDPPVYNSTPPPQLLSLSIPLPWFSLPFSAPAPTWHTRYLSVSPYQ